MRKVSQGESKAGAWTTAEVISTEAASSFGGFLGRIPAGGRICVLSHNDADGLAANAVLHKALRGRGYEVWSELTGKGESAWTESVLQRVANGSPQALLVADLGSRAEPLVPGTETLLIDHHRPTGVPPGAVLITGYDSDPAPTSSLLAFWCAGAQPELEWIAALGILGDLGDRVPFPALRQAARRFGKAQLREVATLINAPRKAASGDGWSALALLLRHETPHALLADTDVELLRAAKAEFEQQLAVARRVAPIFSGPVALLRTQSPCQVHPMVAQTWRNRLRSSIVMCANSGFLPGRVNFAVRTALPLNLLEWLADFRPGDAGEDYGRGHDSATGGSLPFATWNEFTAKLGFGPEAFAGPSGWGPPYT